MSASDSSSLSEAATTTSPAPKTVAEILATLTPEEASRLVLLVKALPVPAVPSAPPSGAEGTHTAQPPSVP